MLTVIGPRTLAAPRELSELTYHLASRQVPPERFAAVAVACTPWLRTTVPTLARACDWMPLDYPTSAEYAAWLDGLTAGFGGRVWVPPPPFILTRNLDVPPPPPADLSPNLVIRPDAHDHLRRQNRDN